jgi:hypothetical protein
MSRLLRVGLVCGLFALVAVPARADDPQKDSPKDAAKATGERLSLDSLRAILEGLGYEEVEELKDKDGNVLAYQVKRVEDSWVYYATFEISPDQSNVWISLNGPKIGDTNAVPAKVLLEMLTVNEDLWPSYFYYSEKANRFTLCLPVRNSGLKAKDIRGKFDTLSAQFKKHEHLWNPERWTDVRAAEKQKPN